MNKSLDQALLAFHAKNVSIKRDRSVSAGRMNYNYATLDEILDVVRPLLAEQGLYLSGGYETIGDRMIGYTRVVHAETGDSECCYFPIDFNASPQDFGKQQTYGRRYSITNLLALATEEDDDANGHSAVAREVVNTPVRAAARPAGAFI